ncbi:hypothetical protein F0P96_15375 [Hymenobacter busanensis]|uniref:Uncharacterized protein n=1 Tax=Hymenobacter busanensis TaxID=2607656 RepID=A0A7L5A0P4_9BACT|nr:hypothetical protein [Hymenobacter busanensis]KAA9331612.1 hypothetical protein F0P96_15375 [Hymenobacter busanensis]QHJ08763.1 hypothetical protein GUY19_16310 [Hymenobacter busanensis]
MDLETLLTYNRWLHIGCGMIGFFVAPVALATRKGGGAHRFWGKVFFWAMLTAGVTAIAAAAFKGLTFLLLTGVFSLYLSYLGYRALYQKRLGRGQQPALYDWLGSGLGLLVFIGTVAYGAATRQLVPVVFGLIGARLAYGELRKLYRPAPDATCWFFDHMRGFVISYIAAVSAFSATSFTFLPVEVRFLWPTAVGTPLLAWWIYRYKKQFANGRRMADVAQLRPEAQPLARVS